jgi:uncharacterized protein YeeX (DUF496 family)
LNARFLKTDRRIRKKYISNAKHILVGHRASLYIQSNISIYSIFSVIYATMASQTSQVKQDLLMRMIDLDRRRDELLAELADCAIEEEATNIPIWCTDEQRQRRKDAYTKRLARREWERANLDGKITPPGDWDHDLDTYLVKNDPIDFGDGYKGHITIDPTHMVWRGSIELPAGHPCLDEDYNLNDVLFMSAYPEGANRIHFVHCHCDAAMARYRYIPSFYHANGTRCFRNLQWVSYEEIMAECQQMVDYFKTKAAK